MESSWRFKTALLLVLTIPAFGAWQYTKHYLIKTNETHLSLHELPFKVKPELQQVRLDGFTAKDVDPISSSTHEYVCVESTSDSSVFILKRRKDLEDSISNRIQDDSVCGLVSNENSISKDAARELGLEIPEFLAPNRILVVDVDRDYLSSIAGLTFGFSCLGLIALGFAYIHLDKTSFKERHRRNCTQSQVALQLAIAKQDVYRH